MILNSSTPGSIDPMFLDIGTETFDGCYYIEATSGEMVTCPMGYSVYSRCKGLDGGAITCSPLNTVALLECCPLLWLNSV